MKGRHLAVCSAEKVGMQNGCMKLVSLFVETS
jgi:hypothetical protein